MKKFIIIGTLLMLTACGSSDNNRTAQTNQPPTISSLGDQSATVNQLIMLSVEISDDRTALSDLDIVASADNDNIVAELLIEKTATGATLSVVPAEDSPGSSQVLVEVTDESGLSAATNFTVTFELIATDFDELVRTIFQSPANGQPVSVNELDISGSEANFDDLVETDS